MSWLCRIWIHRWVIIRDGFVRLEQCGRCPKVREIARCPLNGSISKTYNNINEYKFDNKEEIVGIQKKTPKNKGTNMQVTETEETK